MTGDTMEPGVWRGARCDGADRSSRTALRTAENHDPENQVLGGGGDSGRGIQGASGDTSCYHDREGDGEGLQKTEAGCVLACTRGAHPLPAAWPPWACRCRFRVTFLSPGPRARQGRPLSGAMPWASCPAEPRQTGRHHQAGCLVEAKHPAHPDLVSFSIAVCRTLAGTHPDLVSWRNSLSMWTPV